MGPSGSIQDPGAGEEGKESVCVYSPPEPRLLAQREAVGVFDIFLAFNPDGKGKLKIKSERFLLLLKKIEWPNSTPALQTQIADILESNPEGKRHPRALIQKVKDCFKNACLTRRQAVDLVLVIRKAKKELLELEETSNVTGILVSSGLHLDYNKRFKDAKVTYGELISLRSREDEETFARKLRVKPGHMVRLRRAIKKALAREESLKNTGAFYIDCQTFGINANGKAGITFVNHRLSKVHVGPAFKSLTSAGVKSYYWFGTSNVPLDKNSTPIPTLSNSSPSFMGVDAGIENDTEEIGLYAPSHQFQMGPQPWGGADFDVSPDVTGTNFNSPFPKNAVPGSGKSQCYFPHHYRRTNLYRVIQERDSIGDWVTRSRNGLVYREYKITGWKSLISGSPLSQKYYFGVGIAVRTPWNSSQNGLDLRNRKSARFRDRAFADAFVATFANADKDTKCDREGYWTRKIYTDMGFLSEREIPNPTCFSNFSKVLKGNTFSEFTSGWFLTWLQSSLNGILRFFLTSEETEVSRQKDSTLQFTSEIDADEIDDTICLGLLVNVDEFRMHVFVNGRCVVDGEEFGPLPLKIDSRWNPLDCTRLWSHGSERSKRVDAASCNYSGESPPERKTKGLEVDGSYYPTLYFFNPRHAISAEILPSSPSKIPKYMATAINGRDFNVENRRHLERHLTIGRILIIVFSFHEGIGYNPGLDTYHHFISWLPEWGLNLRTLLKLSIDYVVIVQLLLLFGRKERFVSWEHSSALLGVLIFTPLSPWICRWSVRIVSQMHFDACPLLYKIYMNDVKTPWFAMRLLEAPWIILKVAVAVGLHASYTVSLLAVMLDLNPVCSR